MQPAPPTPSAAQLLRSLHVPGAPLVLVNVWDVASARAVVAAGAAVVGTSSAAVADTFGATDDDTMEAPLAFGAIRRIAAAVPVPVTADIEAGYGLDGRQLVEALLGAGAVGCNLEDTDHRGGGTLMDADVMANRVADVRRAAAAAGVDIVINARIDVFRNHGDDRPAALAEIVRRAGRYHDAGADCVFPIGVSDPATTEWLVGRLGVPVNVGLGTGTTVAEVAAAGASRISVGPTLHRRAMADLGERARAILAAARGSAAD